MFCTYTINQQMHIFKYVQSLVILHQPKHDSEA